MEFLNSREFLVSLIIEAGLLLLVAIGIIIYLLRRLIRLAKQSKHFSGNDANLLEYLRAEIEKTREKQSMLGTNGSEAKQLQAACDLRCRVLEGEILVFESSVADNTHYWRPVLEYYETIRGDFATQINTLEDRLATSMKRIANLEKFKERLFDLRDRLNQSYQNNSRLEKELREKIKQGSKLSELEHTLSQMENEKEGLAKELKLAEDEFMVIMENAASGSMKVINLNVDSPDVDITETSDDKKLEARLASLEEENEFLCDQIQALLTLELEMGGKEEVRDHEFLELEKRYAKMEERYLKLQEELDMRN